MRCIILLIKSIHIKSVLLFGTILCIIVLSFLLVPYFFAPKKIKEDSSFDNTKILEENLSIKPPAEAKKEYIKWVDFNIPSNVLEQVAKLDIDSHTKDGKQKYNWIELLAYLACKNGGNFNTFKTSHLQDLKSKLDSGKTMAELTKDNQYYSYYYEAYQTVLGGLIGEHQIQTEVNGPFVSKYGLKAFCPIAKNYGFSHYKDFGNSRSYGFARKHLGNDLMGSIGTPIIAVETGTIEALGWNQYGGWRIGIRSLDKKRYYYYAHLRKDHPYHPDLKEGQLVKAGDVIGYLGMTGYSTKENVNNINVPHLHFGLQLIFDESQKEGNNEIWINVYDIVEFLKKNRSEVVKSNTETKDYHRKYDFIEENSFTK